MHNCYNKPKPIVYRKQILLEKNLHIKEKNFEDYFREAEDKYYNRLQILCRRIGLNEYQSPTKIVLSKHLYRMMMSEIQSCYFLEHQPGYTQYDKPKMKYRGCEVELNPYNEDEEINLF